MLPTRCTGKFKKISLKGNFRTLGKSFDTKNYPPVLLIPHNNNYAKMNNYEPVLEEKKIDAIPEPYIKEGSPYGNKHNFSEITYRRCLAQNQILNSGWFKVGKVIIIGDSSVGKTGIVNRFSQKVFNSQYKTTIGVDFDVQRFRILNVFYTLQIWDTAGQERFKCIAQSYYRNSQAVIVVFDLNNLKSLSNSKKWLSEALEANSPTKPLIFLVGTKADLVGQFTLKTTEKIAINVAEKLSAEYWTVSAKNGKNISALFRRIAALCFDNLMVSYEDETEKINVQIGEKLIRPKNKNRTTIDEKSKHPRKECCKMI